MLDSDNWPRHARRAGDQANRNLPTKNDLPLILNKIVSEMSGRATMLSVHSEDGAGSAIIEMSPSIRIAGHEATAFELAARFAAGAGDGKCTWSRGTFGIGSAVMLVTMDRIADHGRLVISIFFDALTDAAMEEAERAYHELSPFARGYFRLWQTERALRRRSRATEAAFDQIDTGFLLLNRAGDILFANFAAKVMLDAGDGLRRVRNSIGAARITDGVTLQVALDSVIAANADSGPDGVPPVPVMALSRGSGPPLIVMLLAMPVKAIGPADAAVGIYLSDPTLDTGALLASVCRLYRLSPVETTLVTHLAQGLPLAEAAHLMHIRELTARTYMKQIFVKTDTNRQTELVVLMLSSIVRMRPATLDSVLPLIA